MLLSTIQMANLAANIVQTGLFYTPHLVERGFNSESIRNTGRYRTQKYSAIDKNILNRLLMEWNLQFGWRHASKTPNPNRNFVEKQGHPKTHGKIIQYFLHLPIENPKILNCSVYVEKYGLGEM